MGVVNAGSFRFIKGETQPCDDVHRYHLRRGYHWPYNLYAERDVFTYNGDKRKAANTECTFYPQRLLALDTDADELGLK
jgi:hypothetical protein